MRICFVVFASCLLFTGCAELRQAIMPDMPPPSFKTYEMSENADVAFVPSSTSAINTEIVKKVRPNIAKVFDFKSGKTGSACILTRSLAVTNAHVVTKNGRVGLLLHDGTRVSAKVLAVDQDTDLALLRMKTKKANLPRGLLLRTGGCVQGEAVLTFGYGNRGPNFYSQVSVRDGIISCPDIRRFNSGVPLIEVSAPLNHGDSGGAIVSAVDGKLVGITVGNLVGGPGTAVDAGQILSRFSRFLKLKGK